MIIRLSHTGVLLAFDNINSKSARDGSGRGWSELKQKVYPLHDTFCGVFAHSRRLRRLALKESKCPV